MQAYWLCRRRFVELWNAGFVQQRFEDWCGVLARSTPGGVGGFEMGPYGSICAHIKTGWSHMAQDHFKTPPDPPKGYKNQKMVPKISELVGVVLG